MPTIRDDAIINAFTKLQRIKAGISYDEWDLSYEEMVLIDITLQAENKAENQLRKHMQAQKRG